MINEKIIATTHELLFNENFFMSQTISWRILF